MPWRHRALLPVVLVAMVGACGGDDDASSPATDGAPGSSVSTSGAPSSGASDTGASRPETTTSGSADDEVCGPMRALAEFNASNDTIESSPDWETLQENIAAELPGGIQLYDDAIAAAPDEIRPDVESLKAFTEDVADVVQQAEGPEELAQYIQENGAELQEPTLRLDGWLRTNCGFGLTQD